MLHSFLGQGGIGKSLTDVRSGGPKAITSVWERPARPPLHARFSGPATPPAGTLGSRWGGGRPRSGRRRLELGGLGDRGVAREESTDLVRRSRPREQEALRKVAVEIPHRGELAV